MTTAAQVKRAVKPWLDRHEDLRLCGRTIVVMPVQHVLRGILIDRTSDADYFKPKWFAVHLFEQTHFAALDWGGQVYLKSHGSWRWSQDNAMPVLFDELEKTILPQLRSIRDIGQLIEFVSGHVFSHKLFDWTHRKLLFDVALGDLNSARILCETKVAKWTEATYGRDDDDKAKLRRLQELCRRLAADDRAGMAALLHEWEATTVRNLKLGHLHEKTPFPLELLPA
jgi:hypothetical protein